MPIGNRLVITGEGILEAHGGDAGNGGDGGNGGSGYINTKEEYGAAGAGGTGGIGGGGAGAGIGGDGGRGYYAEPVSFPTRKCTKEEFACRGYEGRISVRGDDGVDMGRVYILGTVTVRANRGNASSVGGKPGTYGANGRDSGSGWWYAWTGGAGAPGGGGGSGWAPKYGIGGGGAAGNSGGTGSTGGTHWSYSRHYIIGQAGEGGKGYVNGTKYSSNKPEYDELGQKGGSNVQNVARTGNDGYLYSTSGGIYGSRPSAWLSDKDIPASAAIEVIFDKRSGVSGHDKTTVFLGYKSKQRIDVPAYTGKVFKGYYTHPEGGERIFDAQGNQVEIINSTDDKIYLYAQWTDMRVTNVNAERGYAESAQQALADAEEGHVIRLLCDINEELVINKGITLDLNGNSVDSLLINITGNTRVTILNGSVLSIKGDGVGGRGRIDFSNIRVSRLYTASYDISISNGIYDTINVQRSHNDNKVVIKGDDCYVGDIRYDMSDIRNRVLLLGGYYTKPLSESDNVIALPLNYEMIKIRKQSEMAPDTTYMYKVSLKKNFVNSVSLKNQDINTEQTVNEKSKVTCHFRFDNPTPYLIPVFGCTNDATALSEARGGFAFIVDGARKSFRYCCGTDFYESEPDMLQEGKDYYVTISKGYLRIDTMKNAQYDYYHKNIAMLKMVPCKNTIKIGDVNGYSTNNFVQDVTICDFTYSEGDEMLMHLVPAFGNSDRVFGDDFCLYDMQKRKIHYDTDGQKCNSGIIGKCKSHPAYRVPMSGNAKEHFCVVCGLGESIEDYVETNKTVFTLPQESLKAPKYLLHYAERGGDFAEYVDVKSQTAPKLENMKFFSCKVYDGETLKHHYVPTSVCGLYYLYDKQTATYHPLADQNPTSNIAKSSMHLMDTLQAEHPEWGFNDIIRCRICHVQNRLMFDKTYRFNLDRQATDKTNIYVRRKKEIGNDEECVDFKCTPGDKLYIGEGSTITEYEWVIKENGTIVAHYLPSQYKEKPCLFDIVSQKIIEPETWTGVDYKKYVSVESCGDHKYISDEIEVVSNENYNRCLLCNALVKWSPYCREHKKWTITKEPLNSGKELWTRTCRHCKYSEIMQGGPNYIVTNGEECFDIQETKGKDIIYDFNVSKENYHVAIFNGKVGLYDETHDTFIKCKSDSASAYVPTCSNHRFFELSVTDTDKDKKFEKHCKICDAKVRLNGICIKSEEVLRDSIYKENLEYDMYIDMECENGSADRNKTYKKYPKLNEKNIIFSIAVMHQGKLISYFVPAQRHVDGKKVPGMYNVVTETFTELSGAQLYISDCHHPYNGQKYEDGLIKANCSVCDTTYSTVGYYKTISYYGNGGKGVMGKQTITTLSDEKGSTLYRNRFSNGAYFFKGWKDDNGIEYADGDFVTVSADDYGFLNLSAVWNDGFICNGDTLEVNSDNTSDITIYDDGLRGFDATSTFRANKISYVRRIEREEGIWGTVVLPFAVTQENQKDIILYMVTGIDDGEHGTRILLDRAENIAAGQPFIYQIKDGVELPDNRFVISESDVDVTPELPVYGVDNVSVVGSYEYTTFQCNDKDRYFAIFNDTFYQLTSSLTVRPFRAYLYAEGLQSLASKEVLYLHFDDSATDVKLERSNIAVEGEWYTPEGIRVQTPQAGRTNIFKANDGTVMKFMK